jgi:hypothetical protein
LQLLDKGEQRLIQAVERRVMPLWLAIEVARLPSDEVQVAMVAAYGAGTLKGDPNGAAQQRGEPVVAQCWARRTVKGPRLAGTRHLEEN